MDTIIKKPIDTTLRLWYLSLSLGMAAFAISLYSLYHYKKKNGY